MTVKIPEYSTLIGSPTTILRLMSEARFFDHPEGDDYIQTVQADAKRLDIDLEVAGDTYEERAESLLKAMAANNMIIIEEE